MGSTLLPPLGSHTVYCPSLQLTLPLLTPCPQACKNNICLDLSPGHGLDGRLTGHTVETWDVKVCVCVWAVWAGGVSMGTRVQGGLERDTVTWEVFSFIYLFY